MTEPLLITITDPRVHAAMVKAVAELKDRGFVPFPAETSLERSAAMAVLYRKTTKIGDEARSNFVITELSTNLEAYLDGTLLQRAGLQIQAAERASHGLRPAINAPEATPDA